MKHNLVALTGFSRSGKDEAASPLIKAGWERRCFGDIIKSQVAELCKYHLGFSSFTENDDQKKQIRGLLEQWGESNYAGIMEWFFDTLPDRCVNTRLCRVKEAEEWRKRGGIIVEVKRFDMIDVPKYPKFRGQRTAQTTWEAQAMASLHQADMVDLIVENDGTVEQLHDVMTRLFITGELSIDRCTGNRPRTFRSACPLETYAAR